MVLPGRCALPGYSMVLPALMFFTASALTDAELPPPDYREYRHRHIDSAAYFRYVQHRPEKSRISSSCRHTEKRIFPGFLYETKLKENRRPPLSTKSLEEMWHSASSDDCFWQYGWQCFTGTRWTGIMSFQSRSKSSWKTSLSGISFYEHLEPISFPASRRASSRHERRKSFSLSNI